MPGARYGVSKEKDEQFLFSRINQAEPDVALFFAGSVSLEFVLKKSDSDIENNSQQEK